MVQSPAIDVIGVGYLDGNVHLFDIRQDELVMQMKMEDGAVSSLSFRTGWSLFSFITNFSLEKGV